MADPHTPPATTPAQPLPQGKRTRNITLNAVQLKMLDELISRHVDQADVAEIISGLPDTTGTPGPRISDRSLRRRYGREIRKALATGRSLLHTAQWNRALGGNVTAQIWLGKQYLGQKDKIEATGAGGIPLIPPPVAPRTEVYFIVPDNGRDATQSRIGLLDLTRKHGLRQPGDGATLPLPSGPALELDNGNGDNGNGDDPDDENGDNGNGEDDDA